MRGSPVWTLSHPLFLRTIAAPMLAFLGRFACAQAPVDTVPLPDFYVVESRELPPPEKWLYTRIDGLEVISSASESSTRFIVRDFARFRQALDLVWPDVQQNTARLGSLVICNRPGQFDPFRPTAGLAWPAQIALPLPAQPSGALVLDLSRKVIAPGDMDGVFVASSATPQMMQLYPSGGTVPIGGLSAPSGAIPPIRGPDREVGVESVGDSQRQLYRAYLRLIIGSAEPRPPAWFEEGLAQLFMAMRITNRDIVVGEVEDPAATAEVDGSTAAIPDLDFNAVLSQTGILPMGTLLTLKREVFDSNQTSVVAAKQAYAFVHWGIYGDGGRHQKAFVTLIARLSREPLTEELFQRTLGQTYRQMEFTLRAYAEATSHMVAGVERKAGYKLPSPPAFDLRPATEAESARVKGEALLAAGHADLARDAMSIPYRRGDRDPRLLAALGLVELRRGEHGVARTFLDMAAAAGTTNPRALVELAHLRFADAIAKPAGGDGRLSARQVAAVLTPLFAARAQPPRLPEVYELIADAWEKSVVTPERDHLAVLDETVRYFPGRIDLIYRNAVLKLHSQLNDEAATLVAIGLERTNDPQQRARLTALQAQLPSRNIN